MWRYKEEEVQNKFNEIGGLCCPWNSSCWKDEVSWFDIYVENYTPELFQGQT